MAATRTTSTGGNATAGTAAKKPAAKTTTTKKPAAKTTTTTTTTKKPAAKTTTTTKKPAAKTTTTKKPAAKTTTTKKPSAKTTTTTAKKPSAKTTTTKKPAAKTTTTTTTKKPAAKTTTTKKPSARKPKSPFTDAFLKKQHQALLEERARYLNQAETLQQEADQLAADREPGDVQFDEESGEGDTIAVERERDLTLSAQARDAVRQIDEALDRYDRGVYGICIHSGEPIPKARLEAIPWAAEKVEFKVARLGS